MGTNYYLRTPACVSCGHHKHELHIGKSSGGWFFGLRIYLAGDDKLEAFGVAEIRELDDWRPLFEKFPIYDEYGEKVEPAELLAAITERSHPNGLLSRLTAGPEHMGPYGHLDADKRFAGKGTYDLLNFEFS
jgi:hypothetical protein